MATARALQKLCLSGAPVEAASAWPRENGGIPLCWRPAQNRQRCPYVGMACLLGDEAAIWECRFWVCVVIEAKHNVISTKNVKSVSRLYSGTSVRPDTI